jgi:hypothetical protein
MTALLGRAVRGVSIASPVEPVRIEVPDAELHGLRERLRRTRRPEPATVPGRARGGHFAALEQPAVFVDELRAFFRLVR